MRWSAYDDTAICREIRRLLPEQRASRCGPGESEAQQRYERRRLERQWSPVGTAARIGSGKHLVNKYGPTSGYAPMFSFAWYSWSHVTSSWKLLVRTRGQGASEQAPATARALPGIISAAMNRRVSELASRPVGRCSVRNSYHV
eukprot:3166999-Rhodomonas_salina.2